MNNTVFTKKGVCKQLNNSPYFVTNFYGGKNADYITFYFSSVFYRDKFLSEYRENRSTINLSLSNRFKIGLVFNILADIVLYYKIEKRGFLISYKGRLIKCKNDIILNGEKMI